MALQRNAGSLIRKDGGLVDDPNCCCDEAPDCNGCFVSPATLLYKIRILLPADDLGCDDGPTNPTPNCDSLTGIDYIVPFDEITGTFPNQQCIYTADFNNGNCFGNFTVRIALFRSGTSNFISIGIFSISGQSPPPALGNLQFTDNNHDGDCGGWVDRVVPQASAQGGCAFFSGVEITAL